jgi:hypothetical protein
MSSMAADEARGPDAYWRACEPPGGYTPAQRRDIVDHLVMRGFDPRDVYPMAGLAVPSQEVVDRLRLAGGLPGIEL